MTWHLYFDPIVTTEHPDEETGTSQFSRRPKYIDLSTTSMSLMDYGTIDLCIVAADMPTLADHQAMFDQTDVLSIDPRTGTNRNLDANATSGEITALLNYLDTAGNFVPMEWATTSMTRREILRTICGMFQLMQALCGVSGQNVKEWGITLSTTWGALSSTQKEYIRQGSLIALGFLPSDPSSGATMRQVLRGIGNLWPIDRPALGGKL